MFCIYCGTNLPDDAKFCPACGEAIWVDNEEAERINDNKMGFLLEEEFACKSADDEIKDCMSTKPLYNDSDEKKENLADFQEISKAAEGFSHNLRKRIVFGALIGIAVAVGIFIAWCAISFPGSNMDAIFHDMTIESITANLFVGARFGEDDLATTPVTVEFISASAFFDKYTDPYVSIVLDITCRSGSWKPEYEDITFWLDGSAAFNQPDYNSDIVKKNETVRYIFTHPLITTNIQDVEMRLSLDCKFGTTVELYFIVDGIQQLLQQTSTEETQEIPTVLRDVDPTEFDGIYANVNDQNEILEINWDDFSLSFSWRNGTTIYFETINVTPYDWGSEGAYSGNSVFVTPETVTPDYNNNYLQYEHHITYTFVPAEYSPYAADMVYAESADFKNVVFVRV